jgi:uncharacterized membrane protein
MAETENQRKSYKGIMVANIVVMTGFLILNTFTRFKDMNIEFTILLFVAGEAFLILVNFLLYRYFSRRNQLSLKK